MHRQLGRTCQRRGGRCVPGPSTSAVRCLLELIGDLVVPPDDTRSRMPDTPVLIFRIGENGRKPRMDKPSLRRSRARNDG
jgi:hypothetical protein